jgi:hypothetical protein
VRVHHASAWSVGAHVLGVFTQTGYKCNQRWREVIEDARKVLHVWYIILYFTVLDFLKEFVGNKTSWGLGPKCDRKACMDCLAGQKLKCRLNQVLVLSQIAKKNANFG